MKNISIVIDREYGSGGREVARILSEKLGMEFYDGNLLTMAGKEYGIELGVIQEFDEKGVGGILSDIAMMSSVAGPGFKMEQAYSVLERVCVVQNRFVLLYISSVSAHIIPMGQLFRQVNDKEFLEFLCQKCPKIEHY